MTWAYSSTNPSRFVSRQLLHISQSHDLFTVSYEHGSANITAKCHRSMRKSELPRQLHQIVVVDSKAISGECVCVAGLGGYCNHVIGLLYYLAHCKQLAFLSLPDNLTCTSMKERWSIPRERKIGNQEVQSVLVKKPRPYIFSWSFQVWLLVSWLSSSWKYTASFRDSFCYLIR